MYVCMHVCARGVPSTNLGIQNAFGFVVCMYVYVCMCKQVCARARRVQRTISDIRMHQTCMCVFDTDPCQDTFSHIFTHFHM